MPNPNAKEIPMAGGLVSSSECPPYHLIPTEALNRLAYRFAKGVERKGDKAWNAVSQNGDCLLDKQFVLNRISHIIAHAQKLRDKLACDLPLDDDDDAGAIIWGGAFLCCATSSISGVQPLDNPQTSGETKG